MIFTWKKFKQKIYSTYLARFIPWYFNFNRNGHGSKFRLQYKWRVFYVSSACLHCSHCIKSRLHDFQADYCLFDCSGAIKIDQINIDRVSHSQRAHLTIIEIDFLWNVVISSNNAMRIKRMINAPYLQFLFCIYSVSMTFISVWRQFIEMLNNSYGCFCLITHKIVRALYGIRSSSFCTISQQKKKEM